MTPFQWRSFDGRDARSGTADQRRETDGDALGRRSLIESDSKRPRINLLCLVSFSLTPALLSINWMVLNYGLLAITVWIAV